MIPIALVTAALLAATEGLRAFNGLDPDQRKKIVDQLLADDAKRRAVWDKICAWLTGLVGKVKI